jgi:hypothetical protein
VRVRRARLAGVLAVVLLACAAGWAPSYVGAAQCGTTQHSGGRWSAVDMPPTASIPEVGPSAVVASTIVGQDPSVVLATDGVSVFRSTDYGCSWRLTYTFGAADYWSGGGLVTGYSITNIANAHSAVPANRQDVYLALSPNPLNVFTFVTLFAFAPPELIAASHDGGQTFAIVQSTPTVGHPIVPECLEAPTAMAVPPTNGREIYLQCQPGLAQGVAESEVAANDSYVYRSMDGGVSWSLLGLPTYPVYASQWFVVGPKAKELWIAGQWTPPNGENYYLAVWHSTDDGLHWARSTPAGRPGVGIGPIGIATDPTADGRGERVVVYASIGAFATTDGGKHWTKLSGLGTANGSMYISVAFYLRHSLYVVGMTGPYGCKAGTVLLRYANPRAKPTRTPFPSRWGYYGTWGAGGSFTVVGGASVAFGAATFCAPPKGKASPPQLLSFGPR